MNFGRKFSTTEGLMTKVSALLLLGMVLGFALPAFAAVPELLPVQGFLTNADGEPIDGNTTIRFRLYKSKAADAASVVFDETRNVPVDDGHFTVYLGDTAKLDLGLFAKHATLFVGLQIADDPKELTPLLQLATAPYAAHAQSCGDAQTLGGKTAEELMSTSEGSAYENLEAEGKLAGDADDSLVTRAQGDARYTRMAGCYWKYKACQTSTCVITCDEEQAIVGGGCDAPSGTDPGFLLESFPGPSRGYGDNDTGPWPHGVDPSKPNAPIFDSWSCRVKEGVAAGQAYAFCCPRI